MTSLTQFYISENLKLFIDWFSELVELLFLCDVTFLVKTCIRPLLLVACFNSAGNLIRLWSMSDFNSFFTSCIYCVRYFSSGSDWCTFLEDNLNYHWNFKKNLKSGWNIQCDKMWTFFDTYQVQRHSPLKDVIRLWTSSEKVGAHHRAKFSSPSSAALSSPYKQDILQQEITQTNRILHSDWCIYIKRVSKCFICLTMKLKTWNQWHIWHKIKFIFVKACIYLLDI